MAQIYKLSCQLGKIAHVACQAGSDGAQNSQHFFITHEFNKNQNLEQVKISSKWPCARGIFTQPIVHSSVIIIIPVETGGGLRHPAGLPTAVHVPLLRAETGDGLGGAVVRPPLQGCQVRGGGGGPLGRRQQVLQARVVRRNCMII